MAKNILLYRASAGSGKTFTLVSEYLKSALLTPAHFRNILAITFTNKATAEMKDRIISYLHKLSNGDAQDMHSLLQTSLPHINIQQNAKELLKLILHNYSDFSVMTIDSFFSMLLKSFAYELQLPPDMNILLHQQTALEYSVNELIADYSNNINTKKWLQEFVQDKIAQGKKWKVDYDIRNLAQELLKNELEFADEENEEKLRDIIRLCQSKITGYESTLSNIAELCIKHIEDSQNTEHFNKIFISFLKKILDKKVEINSTISKIINGETIPLSKKLVESGNKDVLLFWENTIQPLFDSIIDFHYKNLTIYNTSLLVKKNFYSYILLRDINKKIQEFRLKEGLILIQDINHLIAQLVKTDSVPFIYEKSGMRYDTILIDEFQDTSNVQWQNILPLLLELLAKGGDKILVVGDAKQSIYRWRGGNLDLILNNIFKDLLPFSKEQISDNTLATNYRSHEAIITFNNLIFSKAEDFLKNFSGKIKNVYAAPTQLCTEAHKGKGLVSIDFFISWKYKNSLSIEEKQQLEDEYCQTTLRRIHEALEDGYQYSDIALLIRRNKEATYFANLLNAHNIPVLSSEALLFAAHPIVDGLIAGIYYLRNPKESLYYYTLLKKIAEILALPYSIEDIVLHEEIQKKITSIDSIISLKYLPLQRILIQLLKTVFKIEIDDITTQFLDIIFNRRIDTIDDFITFWEDEGQTMAAVVDRRNAVQIFTIHKSKGLEFPVVILPDPSWKFNEFSTGLKHKYLWLSTDAYPYNILKKYPVEYSAIMEDSIYRDDFYSEMESMQLDVFNMLYVAMTRAAERLHIITPEQKNVKDVNSTDKLIYSILKKEYGISENIPYEMGNRIPKLSDKSVKSEISISTSLPNHNSEFSCRPLPYRDELMLKGEVLHEILSLWHVSDNTTGIILKTLNKYKIPTDELPIYSDIINQIQNHSQWKTWNNHYYNRFVEQELYWEGKIIRPDLFFMNKDDIALIDFKTGNPDQSHFRQLKEYATALRQIFNKKVSSHLIYIYPHVSIKSIDGN
jgi:ATP-dependent exoDNAse (exonuclease V) beta subunit